MRTHVQIIRDAGGPVKLMEALGLPRPMVFRVRSWALRDSIPCRYWWPLALMGFATLEELAVAAWRKSISVSA
jgi:hypothetical protein